MPVTDLVFGGRWPEERRQEAKGASGQQRARDSTSPPVAKEREKPASPTDLATAIEPLKRAAESLNSRVDIQYRDDIEKVVMVVYRKDPETGQDTEEIIRQIPPEAAVKLAQQLEQGKATILDEIA